MEVWKAIPSEPDLEASSLGRIRVIPHLEEMPHGGFRLYGGTPTFGQWAKDARRYLYCRKHHKTRKVAVLVCEAFHGPAPEGLNCLHMDEDSRNNVPDNLKWGTQEENLNCPNFLAYCRSRTGENNPRTKGLTSKLLS
jgi:HNH endonuclease